MYNKMLLFIQNKSFFSDKTKTQLLKMKVFNLKSKSDEIILANCVEMKLESVVSSFTKYLGRIAYDINNSTNRKELFKRKFDEVANELMDFTEVHEKLIVFVWNIIEIANNSNKIETITFIPSERISVIEKLYSSLLYTATDEMYRKCISGKIRFSYDNRVNYKNITNCFETIYKKSVITIS